jgi:hypothetical protein
MAGDGELFFKRHPGSLVPDSSLPACLAIALLAWVNETRAPVMAVLKLMD